MTQYVNEQVKKVEKPIFLWVCVGMFGLLSLIYIYFINSAVFMTMELEDYSKEAAVLSSKIADNESKHTSMLANLSEQVATEKGFKRASSANVHYVSLEAGVAFRDSGL